MLSEINVFVFFTIGRLCVGVHAFIDSMYIISYKTVCDEQTKAVMPAFKLPAY